MTLCQNKWQVVQSSWPHSVFIIKSFNGTVLRTKAVVDPSMATRAWAAYAVRASKDGRLMKRPKIINYQSIAV